MMYSRFLPAIFAALSLSFNSLSMAQQPKYDLPGNSHFSKDKFISRLEAILLPDSRLILGSARLVPWSSYAGVKNTEKSVASNRMVWEVLRFYCNQAPPEKIKYYYSAVDAQTGRQLTKKQDQYTYNVRSLPSIQAYGPQWEYPRCR